MRFSEVPVLLVQFRQDPESNWWTATMPDEPAVVTQGKTLGETYANVRSALSLVREDADSVQLRGDIDWSDRHDLAADIRQVVEHESNLRVRFLEIQDQLERATRIAVRVLVGSRQYSVRDAGSLLGITGQRVEQISKLILQSELPKKSVE